MWFARRQSCFQLATMLKRRLNFKPDTMETEQYGSSSPRQTRKVLEREKCFFRKNLVHLEKAVATPKTGKYLDNIVQISKVESCQHQIRRIMRIISVLSIAEYTHMRANVIRIVSENFLYRLVVKHCSKIRFRTRNGILSEEIARTSKRSMFKIWKKEIEQVLGRKVALIYSLL